MKNLLFTFILLIVFISLQSCGYTDSSLGMNNKLGVTPGGSQDNGYARELISRGIVPTSESFTYEGAFSEHDFFINTDTQCDNTICIDTVLSKYKPIVNSNGKDKYIAQLIMSSNIDAENFKHQPIDLFIVLDKSGSMAGNRFEKSKKAIISMIEKLNPEDSLGLITFDNSYKVERRLKPIGNNKNSIISQVNNFQIGGSTNIESALRKAYKLLDDGGDKNNKRIILITDARPNVNATGEGEFLDLIREYEDEIGLTVFGVGVDFGLSLAKAISETKGGNYIFLPTIEEIQSKIDDNFEYLISPIANNFNLEIKSSKNFKIIRSYGLPESEDEEIKLSAKTLFLSKSKGAIAIEFEYENKDNGDIIVPMNNEKVFSFNWSYDDLNDVKFERSEYTYFSPFATTSGNYAFTISGSEKLPFLVNMIIALKKVCDLYSEGLYTQGVELLNKLLADLDSVNSILQDNQLNKEKLMIEQLKEIIENQVNSMENN